MPDQHPTENPNLIPPDSASFFKGFIGRQDEVSAQFAATGHEQTIMISGGKGLPPIIQKQASDSGLYCTSVFLPHELSPRKGTQHELKTGPADWMIGIFSLCLLLLIISRVFFQRRFDQIFNAFLSPRQLTLMIREGNILRERITPPLVLLHMLSLSLFFYLVVNQLIPDKSLTPGGIYLFLIILAAYALFYGLRLLMIQMTGWIFETKEATNHYLVNATVMDEMLGIFLLPFSLVMLVSSHLYGNAVPGTGLALFALILLYRLIRNFLAGLSSAKFSWLYLFLYLCTVEILPVITFGKLINDWLLA